MAIATPEARACELLPAFTGLALRDDPRRSAWESLSVDLVDTIHTDRGIVAVYTVPSRSKPNIVHQVQVQHVGYRRYRVLCDEQCEANVWGRVCGHRKAVASKAGLSGQVVA